MREIFITGTGIISPQDTLNSSSFLENIQEYSSNAIYCMEPEYKNYIPVRDLRRMSRILKMSNVAAQVALQDAELERPDAINVATGLGCLADTEKFLLNLIENDETLLNPTAFINSTHNTIAGQLALMLQVSHQNFTFAHNELTFEHALLDSLLLLKNGVYHHVLTGGVDEITENTNTIIRNLGFLKNDNISNLELLNSPGNGSIQGEGAAYFVLSDKTSSDNYSRIGDVSFFYNNIKKDTIVEEIIAFLRKNRLKIHDIDLVISGYNGDDTYDSVYRELGSGLFRETAQAYYKHLCGEYFTSASFALWLGVSILKEQIIPGAVLLNRRRSKNIKKILLHNIGFYRNHSLILLER